MKDNKSIEALYVTEVVEDNEPVISGQDVKEFIRSIGKREMNLKRFKLSEQEYSVFIPEQIDYIISAAEMKYGASQQLKSIKEKITEELREVKYSTTELKYEDFIISVMEKI